MPSKLTLLNGRGNDAAHYDFRQTDSSLPVPQIRKLYSVFEGFLRSFDARVSARLRCPVTSRVLGVEQQSNAEPPAENEPRTCLFPLSLDPYRASGILELSPSLVFPILGILLGAKGGAETGEGRRITEIERDVLQEVVPSILEELRDAWRQFTPVDFAMSASEANPAIAQEAVVAFGAEVRIRDAMGSMRLAIPVSAVKAMIANSGQQHGGRLAEESVPHAQTLELLKRANVRVEARLEGAGILIRDLLELKQGQVITFSHPVDRPLDCAMNGRSVYKGEMVTMGTRVAFQIVGDVAPEE